MSKRSRHQTCSSARPASFVVIGNPDSRRVDLFQAALAGLGLPPATVVAYADLLGGRVTLPDVVRPGAIVRIESPGKEFEVERALLALGADAAGSEECERLTSQAVRELTFDRGRILPSRQWYLGFCRALRLIEEQLAACPGNRLMNHPADIPPMFDKRRCHELLSRAGLPVPPGLGAVQSFDELVERMRRAVCRRVFVKLAHGSSASGAVAYQTDGRRHQATTTVEMVQRDGELLLYNSRRLRVYRELDQIAALIDALCRHRVHVEQWLPKAGIDGYAFDLRVVVIGGQARHSVVRMSRSPMTNLHLLNRRGSVDAVRARMDPAVWAAALRTCEAAMRSFPASLYAGIDLLVTPDYRHHAVLEANAFGDLLPDLLWEGLDTYATEILAMVSPLPASRRPSSDRIDKMEGTMLPPVASLHSCPHPVDPSPALRVPDPVQNRS